MDQGLERESWFARRRRRLGAMLVRHGEYAEKEWRQTAHLLRVATALLVDRKHVSEADRELARAQLVDLLKTVPASAILAGTFLLPVPGAQPILAPLLMQKLGLLPSTWTADTDVVKELVDLARVAGGSGLADVAAELDTMVRTARREAHKVDLLRSFLERYPDWKVLFDDDLDSRLNEVELTALRRRVVLTALEVRSAGDRREWYVYYKNPDADTTTDLQKTATFRIDSMGETVKGPYVFESIRARFSAEPATLVCRGGKGGWVPLAALLDALQDASDP
jgi:hypothetical protein